MDSKFSSFSFLFPADFLCFFSSELLSEQTKKNKDRKSADQEQKKMKKSGKNLLSIPYLDTLETTCIAEMLEKYRKIGVFVVFFAEWVLMFMIEYEEKNPIPQRLASAGD